jgi:hypothetical protein
MEAVCQSYFLIGQKLLKVACRLSRPRGLGAHSLAIPKGVSSHRGTRLMKDLGIRAQWRLATV